MPQPTPTVSTVLSTVYATDENVAVRAGGDFVTLCPNWQVLAQADDGVIVAGSWVLTSASTTFDAAGSGLRAGNVVVVTRPATAFPGSGLMFAVDSVAGNACTLRRLGQAAGVGAPPSAATVAGISFSVPTMGPQLEEISYQINQTWALDPASGVKNPASIYDQRVLRRLAVLMVLYERYTQEVRTPNSEFSLKWSVVKNDLNELKALTQLKFGSAASGQQSTSIFSTRINR